MHLFASLCAAVAPYAADVAVSGTDIIITNPQNGNMLSVVTESYTGPAMTEPYVSYIVSFSTQHRHFEADDEEELTDYVVAIIRDEILPVEFYLNGQRRFGGEIDRRENPTADSALWLQANGFNAALCAAYTCKITCWSGHADGLSKAVLS